MMLWLIGFGVAFGMWAAGIAGGKGRSALGFGALGFVFGVIGVLAAFLAAPREPAPVYVAFRQPAAAA